MNLAEPTQAITFPPKFTYPIFGDSEQIFGYKNLRIDLAFDCLSLKPLLTYKFSEKLSEDVKKIEDIVSPFLPKDDFILKSETKWLDAIDSEAFQLPKEKIIKTYFEEDNKFDIYKFKLSDDKVGMRLHLRMQIFVLLYIEAGSYIDSKDPLWDLYVIYRTVKGGTKPTFVGFSTTYEHFHYEGFEKHDSKNVSEMKFRGKISQFVILPPFQSQGHGKRLYEEIADRWLKDERCMEITVEDPSEEFDDLRDRCDVQRLLNAEIINQLTALPIDNKWKNDIRKTVKIRKRQFDRCLEMCLVWLITNKKGDWIGNLNEKGLRLEIKKRVYLKNKDSLDELELPDLRDKLQGAFERVREDYDRVVDKISFDADKKRRIEKDQVDATEVDKKKRKLD